MAKFDEGWTFSGTVVWLTPEQGGRTSGPPRPSGTTDYCSIAFVPPHSVVDGAASFCLRNFEEGTWRSPAEGRWLAVENTGDQFVQPGSIVVVCEGHRPVAYFHIERTDPPSQA